MKKKHNKKIAKESGFFIKTKSPLIEPMLEIVFQIDNFLDEVKNNKKLTDAEKAKIITAYKNILINLNDTFKKVSTTYKVHFKEPTIIQNFKTQIKK